MKFTFKGLLCPLLLVLFGGVRLSAADFKIEGGHFLYNGAPVQLICGEMHYPRVAKEYWRDRMRRARAMGINTISTYVFWNIHERQPGVFDFEGQADLAQFVRTAGEEGLFVILRPGPYVCAEWDFGGYPYWLQLDKEMVWRSDDVRFMNACERYITRLGKELSGLTASHGGPIILVQVENEYGSYGNDSVYLRKLRSMIQQAGFDVPTITCDGAGQMGNGSIAGSLPTVNGAVGEDIMRTVDRYRPGGPYFVAEFYPAWFDVWGNPHSHRDWKQPARQLDWMLGHGVSVSMYMFHGGTNFGYTNGANTAYGYQPQPTSYDYDAPLGENGNITAKYRAFREVVQKHLPAGKQLPDIPEENAVSTFRPITFRKSAPLSAAFFERVQSAHPLTMEQLHQDFGYIHYETVVAEAVRGMLRITDLRDYAVVLVNGKYVGSLDRRHHQNKMAVDLPAGARLEILVENVGRVNYGEDLLHNLKGITEKVTIDGREIRNWTMTPLPLYNLTGEIKRYRSPFNFRKFLRAFRESSLPSDSVEAPQFHLGEFELEQQGDLFLDMRGWNKGAVWVNGHSIGKFWNIGPQQTLYVPAPWVKKGKNRIILFEMEGNGQRTLSSLPHPILNQPGHDRHKPVARQRPSQGTPLLDAGDLVASIEMKKEAGKQHFDLPTEVTLRHLCIEIASGYDGANSCLSQLELFDKEGKSVAKDKWSIVYVNSEETPESCAEMLIDEDPASFWHSAWKQKRVPFPHRIIIDLGEIITIGGIELSQRHPGMPGNVRRVNLYGRPQFFLFEKNKK